MHSEFCILNFKWVFNMSRQKYDLEEQTAVSIKLCKIISIGIALISLAILFTVLLNYFYNVRMSRYPDNDGNFMKLQICIISWYLSFVFRADSICHFIKFGPIPQTELKKSNYWTRMENELKLQCKLQSDIHIYSIGNEWTNVNGKILFSP